MGKDPGILLNVNTVKHIQWVLRVLSGFIISIIVILNSICGIYNEVDKYSHVIHNQLYTPPRHPKMAPPGSVQATCPVFSRWWDCDPVMTAYMTVAFVYELSQAPQQPRTRCYHRFTKKEAEAFLPDHTAWTGLSWQLNPRCPGSWANIASPPSPWWLMFLFGGFPVFLGTLFQGVTVFTEAQMWKLRVTLTSFSFYYTSDPQKSGLHIVGHSFLLQFYCFSIKLRTSWGFEALREPFSVLTSSHT